MSVAISPPSDQSVRLEEVISSHVPRHARIPANASRPVLVRHLPKESPPSFPRLRGPHTTRVAVVGGGLTGISCALAFARRVRRSRSSKQTSSGTGRRRARDGFLREGFAGSFHEAVARHGVRTTRALWDGDAQRLAGSGRHTPPAQGQESACADGCPNDSGDPARGRKSAPPGAIRTEGRGRRCGLGDACRRLP